MSNNKISKDGFLQNLNGDQKILLSTLRKACKKIAPLWSLESFVAVNPYLGHTAEKFENVAQELAAAGGIQMTLPTSFYLTKLKNGEIKHEDLANALRKNNVSETPKDFIKIIEVEIDTLEETETIASIADIATQVTSKDWNRFMISRISSWAASYFDNGQAIWSAADQNSGLFESWKVEASLDRTTELTGLKNFRKIVKSLPNNPLDAIRFALEKLDVPEEGMSLYLHRVLLGVGGWSAYAAKLDWENELNNGTDGKLIEFLAVLICWEMCLLESLKNDEVEKKWQEAKEIFSITDVHEDLNQQIVKKMILQDAFDISAQRSIINKLKIQKASISEKQQAKAQAIFCIDVRSEVYRRNLELVDDKIETLGFAGFFAFPINYVPIGHEQGEAQCPVLLNPGPTIMEEIANEQANKKALDNRILQRQVQQVWKSFKSGAVSSFSYVSPMGLSYLPKLFTDSFGITRPVPHPKNNGLSADQAEKITVNLKQSTYHNQTTGIPLDQQIQMAKNALTAMSLTTDFAEFVLITGHGSTMVNNPHATGYDCGACGGHTGEANARVAAAVLNNQLVREGLQKEQILIPSNTVFLACLHDTTTDELHILNQWDVPNDKKNALQELTRSLELAGKATRKERSRRFSNTSASTLDKDIKTRSNDWSEIRPEWGLAGCNAFIVAPRERTKGINLEGQSFLHSYNWKNDTNFSVLELIMTAPMVVTSWINLQYYGSTVDNDKMGAGNKTLHNVTSGLGVLEGFSGDLRVGLPIQSIHDGENYQHEPLRLNVIIEAPIEAMNTILEKHKTVKDLCDNGWLYLLAMDENGEVSHRYQGDLNWEKVDQMAA